MKAEIVITANTRAALVRALEKITETFAVGQCPICGRSEKGAKDEFSWDVVVSGKPPENDKNLQASTRH